MRSRKIVHGLGLLLAVVGIAYAAEFVFDPAGTEASASRPFRALMLAIALTLSCLGAATASGRQGMIKPVIVVVTLTVGLLGLWQFTAEPDTPSTRAMLHPWTALLGCTAILVATWRMRSPWLAVAGVLAITYAATWRHGLDIPAIAAIDAIEEIGATLWFGLDQGALGWVLDASVSIVLSFFFLGSVLASRTFTGRPDGGGDHPGRLVASLSAACRFLVPPLVIGSLLMTQRPGIDLMTTLPISILPIGIGATLFWFMPVNDTRDRRSSGSAWQTALLIGGAMAALALSLAAGFSLQGSAIIALAATLALCTVDPDVRRQPTIILGTLATAGVAFGKLLVLVSVTGMVLAALERSGLPFDIARILAGGLGEAWLPLSLAAAVVAAGLGVVMPGIAAYLIAVALLAPALRTVGLDTLTSHLLVLFVSASASAITAVQAASETRADGSTGATPFGNAASR